VEEGVDVSEERNVWVEGKRAVEVLRERERLFGNEKRV